MNDYVNLHKLLTDERPDFSYCEEKSTFSSGESCSLRNFKLKKQFSELNISFNESNGRLAVKGNWGMFWNGHNLFCPFTDLKEAFGYVSQVINVDLFPALVNEFDHSAVISTTINPKILFQNHFRLPGHLTSEQQYGKWFIRKGQQVVKMYDVGRRIKQLGNKEMRESFYLSSGFDPSMHLVRFEKKILNPHAYFKKLITVSQILQPEFIKQSDNDLMETYHNIIKSGGIQIPTNKRDLTAATITLIAAKELELIFGFNFTDQILKTIASIDESVLTKDDKKARRRQIRANQAKISGNIKSKFDISEPLAASLKMASVSSLPIG